MFSGQTGEFEHCYFGLSKNSLQFGVAQDVSLVCWVLQVVCFDVFPKLLDDFCAGQGGCAHDGGQLSTWLQGFHESGFFFRCSRHVDIVGS